MRLTFSKCILPLALVSTMTFGQQAKSPSAPEPGQQSAAQGSKSFAAQVKAASNTHHQVAHKQYSKAAYKHGTKRAAYRPAYTQNAVEVINGASRQKVVFRDEDTVPGSSKDANAPMKVEVVNGASTDTQYFTPAQESAGAAESNRPVVVAIQSSDTRIVGGNKHLVVTGITSSGTGTAKSAAGGGYPVSKTVSPRPKRPAYQPDAH